MPGAPRWQVSLCKSIATQLLDAGAPLHKVSSFFGHSDPKITVKAYCSESEP
jgi:site-specific recombinase XerD